MLTVLDAGGTPVDVEFPDSTVLGLSEVFDDTDAFSAVAHRLDASGYAECGSRLDQRFPAAALGTRGMEITLHWHCFPRS